MQSGRLCKGDSASTNWNHGPRWGEEDAFEQQIGGRWHIIPCRRRPNLLTTSFSRIASTLHITQVARFSPTRTPFDTNIAVKSIYLHDTKRDLFAQVVEGDQGWVLQGVLSRAILRRPPVSRQKYFTVLSLHVSNIYAKKKGIAKKLILALRAIMISQEVDLVAGDFNDTVWRHRGKDNLSTIDEAFLDSILRTPRGPTPLWGPGSIP